MTSFPGGGRNQLSSERFITFLRTELTWILCTIVLLPIICPAAKYPIPTRKYQAYLRRVAPTANGACSGEMASPFHMKAKAAVAAAAAQQHHHCCCCCCCCVQPQPEHQQQHNRRSRSSSSIAADSISACSIRQNHCEYRTR